MCTIKEASSLPQPGPLTALPVVGVALALLGCSEKKETKEQSQEDVVVANAEPASGQYYTIQPGDTLVSICMKQFQSLDRMDEIMQINNITNKDKIVAGQKIKLWE